MSKFVIKVTYLEGDYKGHFYYLDRKGYCREHLATVTDDDAYTERGCKAACTKKAKNNDIEIKIEQQNRARRIAEGKPVAPYVINHKQSFEPYEIK